MQVGSDVEQPDHLLGLIAHIPRGLSGVEEQLHFERTHVAVYELQERAGQAGNGLRREIVVLVQRVLFGVEEQRLLDIECARNRLVGGRFAYTAHVVVVGVHARDLPLAAPCV